MCTIPFVPPSDMRHKPLNENDYSQTGNWNTMSSAGGRTFNDDTTTEESRKRWRRFSGRRVLRLLTWYGKNLQPVTDCSFLCFLFALIHKIDFNSYLLCLFWLADIDNDIMIKLRQHREKESSNSDEWKRTKQATILFWVFSRRRSRFQTDCDVNFSEKSSVPLNLICL